MKIIKIVILVLISTPLFLSCSKNDETDLVQRFDRNITFKIIGEYNGELRITYSNPDDEFGITPAETTSSLPWNKNLQYKNKIKLTGLSVRGTNGLPNQVIQLQVFSNGELIETEFGIADNEGRLYTETSTIYFN